MELNHSLLRQLSRQAVCLAAVLMGLICIRPAAAADDRAAAITVNHAFATELGTGIYDLGGREIFVLSLMPSRDLRAPRGPRPGVRLVLPVTAGSFDFRPDDPLGSGLPSRIDSFSVMPGVEFDFARPGDWTLTPWARAGASFGEGLGDAWLYGAGLRLTGAWEKGDLGLARRHDISVVVVDYRALAPTDAFVRQRNALDLRRPTLPLGRRHRLLAGLYAILDIVPDPPEAPAGAGRPTPVQLEVGFTFNTDPRVKVGPLRWPRLGLGYRAAGDLSGWRIVFGAPF